MTAARWFATGPDILTAPSAAGAPELATLAALNRARFYGVGLVWEVTEAGAVQRRRYTAQRTEEPVTEEWSK